MKRRPHHRTARRRRTVVTAALVALLALAASGCGVRTQHDAVAIPDDDVSFRLLERTVPTTRPSGVVHISIFLVGEDRLVPVERAVADPTANTALVALLAGPSQSDTSGGLTTALPSLHTARLVSVTNKTATVALSAEFLDGGVRDQATALGQAVYTLTGIGGIVRVRFTLASEGIAVPRADGSLTSRPVGRADYRALAPEP